MIEPRQRPETAPAAPVAATPPVAALVSVAEEASEQVRLMNGIDRAPMSLRAVRENGIEIAGSLFLPRGCEVEVDVKCDAGFGFDGQAELVALHLSGVVHRVAMLDARPTYVLRIDVPSDVEGHLGRIAAALEA